ncbi:MAG: alpha/beta hydrolase [Ilumatobacteraceae bacterium]
MTAAQVNGITIEYDEHGDPGGEPLLLVMGLGAQLIDWPMGFVDLLVERGFRVIRFDNRDIGLSTKIDAPAPTVRQMVMATISPRFAHPAYFLKDMADDAAALLDHLGIESAHVVGASMGGMIAQTIAIEHPAKVRSLVSIMSNTGDRKHGKVAFKLMRRMPKLLAGSRKDPVGGGVVVGRLIAGPHFDEAEARALIEADLARDSDSTGTARQTVAIAGSPDRTADLGRVTVPTLVVHGLVDPLVKPSGGITTAEAIPNAKLLMFPDMGHDLPHNRWDEVAEAIAANAREAKAVLPAS